MGADPEDALTPLRARLAVLRQELGRANAAYRAAVGQRDAGNVVHLLRTRSQLMRQVLDAQCELLLTLRSRPRAADSAIELETPKQELRATSV